jgi:hypothetical protein
MSQATLKWLRKSKCRFSAPYSSQQPAKHRAGNELKISIDSLIKELHSPSDMKESTFHSNFLGFCFISEKAQINF